MKEKKKLPIGIDIFEKLEREEFYYVDKTKMIEELLSNRGEVNLFTRPRRFGKSLNMNMLKSFFDQELLCDYLWRTISIRDTASAKKENFYHGLLLGLLGYEENWIVRSNAESGIGYSDILVEIPERRTGIVIEMKYAENGNMDAACEQALSQIENRQYDSKLKEDGMRKIIKYRIACYKKDCRVILMKKDTL